MFCNSTRLFSIERWPSGRSLLEMKLQPAALSDFRHRFKAGAERPYVLAPSQIFSLSFWRKHERSSITLELRRCFCFITGSNDGVKCKKRSAIHLRHFLLLSGEKWKSLLYICKPQTKTTTLNYIKYHKLLCLLQKMENIHHKSKPLSIRVTARTTGWKAKRKEEQCFEVMQ